MQADLCSALYADRILQRFIRGECRRYSRRDEDRQGDYASAAWTWVLSQAPDRIDRATLKRFMAAAVRNEYVRDSEQRKARASLAVRLVELEEEPERLPLL